MVPFSHLARAITEFVPLTFCGNIELYCWNDTWNETMDGSSELGVYVEDSFVTSKKQPCHVEGLTFLQFHHVPSTSQLIWIRQCHADSHMALIE